MVQLYVRHLGQDLVERRSSCAPSALPQPLPCFASVFDRSILAYQKCLGERKEGFPRDEALERGATVRRRELRELGKKWNRFQHDGERQKLADEVNALLGSLPVFKLEDLEELLGRPLRITFVVNEKREVLFVTPVKMGEEDVFSVSLTAFKHQKALWKAFAAKASLELFAQVVSRGRLPLRELFLEEGEEGRQPVDVLPLLSYANLSGCDGESLFFKQVIKHLDANRVLGLDCSHCEQLESLPHFPNLQELDCSHCPQLKELLSFPYLLELNCFSCENLKQMGSLPKVEKVNCSGCVRLKALPSLPQVRELKCCYCRLSSLPSLPRVRVLECTGNSSVKRLPNLPQVRELKCAYLWKLKELPPLPHLQKLDCSTCINLKRLPPMSHLTQLDCNGCVKLREFSSLPRVEKIISSECPVLELLPSSMPHCEFWEVTRSSLLLEKELSRLVPEACVIHVKWEDYGLLPVPLHRVPFHPFHYLRLLEPELCGRVIQLPPVQYTDEHGNQLDWSDRDGVQKDFITLLMRSLRDHAVDERGFPDCASEFFWGKKDWPTLAGVFLLCLTSDVGFTTGPLFSEDFYRAILAYASPLARALAVQQSSPEIERMVTGELSLQEVCRGKSPEKVGRLLHDIQHFLAPQSRDECWKQVEWVSHYLSQRKHRKSLGKKILKSESESPLFSQRGRAAQMLGEALFSRFSKEKRNELLQLSPKAFQERVEGYFSLEKCLEGVEWVQVEEGQERIREYFENWLREAKKEPEKIEMLLRMVTGLYALPVGKTIQVRCLEGRFPYVGVTKGRNHLDMKGVTSQKQMDEVLERKLSGVGKTPLSSWHDL